MNEQEAILKFLESTLRREYLSRYEALIQTKKGKSKFLKELWHRLEDQFNPEKQIESIPKNVWTSEAYIFGESYGFGMPHASLKEAFDISRDGVLIINMAGTYGIHQA